MSNTSKTPRQLPRVWKTFWSLQTGDVFNVGASTFIKRGLFKATNVFNGSPQPFYPWVRVRSEQLVRDARPGGKSGAESRKSPVRTHYVGDECPGRHLDDQCRERVEQPHNDNATSGPSS